MNQVTVFKYDNKYFETLDELNKYREKELIYKLEDLCNEDEYGKSYAQEFIGILLEYKITSKSKLKDLLSKF